MILGRVEQLLDVCDRLIKNKMHQHENDLSAQDMAELGRAQSAILGTRKRLQNINQRFHKRGIDD